MSGTSNHSNYGLLRDPESKLSGSRVQTPVFMLLFLLVMNTMYSYSQPSRAQRTASNYLTVGAGVDGGGSVTVQIPETGFKIGPVLAYRTGLTATYPFTRTIGSTLDIGLDRRGVEVRTNTSASTYVITNLRYFTITPGIHFSSFWLGLNIGIPIGGNQTYRADEGFQEVVNGFTDSDKAYLATMLEIRSGVVVPIVDTKTWMLNLNFTLGYCLNDIRKNVPEGGGLGNYNGSMVSAHLGMSFQYAIPDTYVP